MSEKKCQVLQHRVPRELFAHEFAKNADLLAQIMRVLFSRLQVTSTAV